MGKLPKDKLEKLPQQVFYRQTASDSGIAILESLAVPCVPEIQSV